MLNGNRDVETVAFYVKRMAGFSDDGSGIVAHEYALGTDQDPISILDYLNAGSDTSMTLLNDIYYLALEHGEQYFFSVRAIDLVGNLSETVTSNGFTVDEYVGPPEIIGLSLDTLNSLIGLTSDTELIISYSEPLGSYDVTLEANFSENSSFNTIYTDDPSMLNVTMVAPFTSLDTLSIALTNIVDLAGISADDRVLKYATGLLGDYDNNMSVDASDLSTFISAWNSNDLSLELGPASGEVPYLTPMKNDIFDLRDIMAFTRMWHWSHETDVPSVMAYESIGEDIDIIQEGDRINLHLPLNATAAHLKVLYPTGNENVSVSNDHDAKKIIQLSHHKKEEGLLVLDKAFIDRDMSKEISFTMNSMDRENIQIEISYAVYGDSSSMVMSGSRLVEVVAVPDNFALHQNYPNPFNPITHIDYDIPDDGYVRMTIYDITGRQVQELVGGWKSAGYYSTVWNGKNSQGQNVSAGLYFCSLISNSFKKNIKLILLK